MPAAALSNSEGPEHSAALDPAPPARGGEERQVEERRSPVPDSAPRKKDDAAKGAPAEPQKKPANPRKRLLLGAIAATIVLGALAYWYHGTFFEDTDDAQIDGYISTISPRVAGTVIAVHVDDNQKVVSGQALVDLDPADLRIARDQARAALAQAEAQLRAEQSNAEVTQTSNQTLVSTSASDIASVQAGVAEARQAVAQANAQLKQAEADARLARLEQERAEQLFASGAVARAELDNRSAARAAADAKLDAAEQSVGRAERMVDEQLAKARAASDRFREAKENTPDVLDAKRATVELRKASVDAARASLEQAELNLSYASIASPVSGVVGKRSVNVGDRVTPGQALLGITQTEKLWVTANFRETQIRNLRVGQRATIHVDALGRDFEGHVASFAAATGARYSVLPPENASGNYVKVVQRLPVRVQLEPKQAGLELLRPGMSVEPKVRVK